MIARLVRSTRWVPGSPQCPIGLPGRSTYDPDDGRSEIMELAEARALVQDKTDKEITVRHLISVEG